MELEVSQQIFGQSSNIKFHENPSNRSQVVHGNGHTDGRREGQDEPIVTFCNFVNAPKNCAVYEIMLNNVVAPAGHKWLYNKVHVLYMLVN
jgi:hypothetical protein